MNAGKSRFALLKEKSNVMNDIIDIAREETNKEESITVKKENNAASQPDTTSKDVIEKPTASESTKPGESGPQADTTSKKAIEKPTAVESAKPEESKAVLDDQKMSEYVNMFMKKIQESSDPRILKKHPQYKGVRYKRSYQYEEHLYDWLLKVNKEKGVDITFMVNEAVRAYLKKEYPECEPGKKS